MNYSSIGKRIKERRKELGLTQENLSEKADLSVSYMGAIERGEKLPSMESFIRIANALDESADRLLSGVLKIEPRIVSSEIYEELSTLPLFEQKRILNVMKTMISDIK